MRLSIGFTMALIGTAGLAEAYGSAGQIITSVLLIAGGAILIRRGLSHEKQNTGGTDDSINRPYYLPRG